MSQCLIRGVTSHCPSWMSACLTVRHSSVAIHVYEPLTKYSKLRFAHAPGMPGTFSPPPGVADPDTYHGTSVTHVPWCMPGSLTSSFLWSRWWGKLFWLAGACATCSFAYPVKGLWFSSLESVRVVSIRNGNTKYSNQVRRNSIIENVKKTNCNI